MDDTKASLDPNTYTVKEMLANFVIPALNDLRDTQTLQAQTNEERFANLEASKNRMQGAILLIVAVVIPLAIPVITQALQL